MLLEVALRAALGVAFGVELGLIVGIINLAELGVALVVALTM